MSPPLLTPVLLVLSSLTMSSQAVRPRGVRVELASLYDPGQEFSCFDGSNTIPFIQVNDDYCDCDVSVGGLSNYLILKINRFAHFQDGSDEPGTSACPEGKFYCENKGHKPLTLPSSRLCNNYRNNNFITIWHILFMFLFHPTAPNFLDPL